MPDTTLHGYRLDSTTPSPALAGEPESGTLCGYPAPAPLSVVEPGRPTQPEPVMDVRGSTETPSAAPSLPAFADVAFDARSFPPVIGEPADRAQSMAWSDEPPRAAHDDAWAASGSKGSEAFGDDEPLPAVAAGVKPGPSIGLLAGAGLAALLVMGTAAALVAWGTSSEPSAMPRRRAAPTAIAATPAPPTVPAPAAALAQAVEAAPVAPTAVTPTPVAAVPRGATRRVAAATPASPSGERVAAPSSPRPSRARRSGGGRAVPTLDDAPMAAAGEAPSLDLGEALAPLGGGAAEPTAQPSGSGSDDSLASLGDRARVVGNETGAEPNPTVSAPPPVVAPSRPGDEVDWSVPFGG